MAEFDFERAWSEAAWPTFERLSATDARLPSLLAAEQAAGIFQQGPTLALPFPEDGALRALYEHAARELPETFGPWVHAVHQASHWLPSNNRPEYHQRVKARALLGSGLGWRIANHADQVLAEVYGFPSHFTRDNGNGISVRIIDACLRVCYTWPRGWTWTEIAPATPATVQAVRAHTWPTRKTGDDTAEAVTEAAEALSTDLWPRDYMPRKAAEVYRITREEQEARAKDPALKTAFQLAHELKRSAEAARESNRRSRGNIEQRNAELARMVAEANSGTFPDDTTALQEARKLALDVLAEAKEGDA